MSLTTERFEQVMLEMEQHAIECRRSMNIQNPGNHMVFNYSLPFDLSVNGEKMPDDVKEIFEVSEYQADSNIREEQSSTQEATGKYLDGGSFDSFEQALLDAEEIAIENFSKARKERTKKLIEAGKKYPGMQGEIVKASAATDSFLLNAYGKIEEFLGKLINTITEWASKAWEAIKNAFNSVISGVKSFFGGLFSLFQSGKQLTIINASEEKIGVLGAGVDNSLGSNKIMTHVWHPHPSDVRFEWENNYFNIAQINMQNQDNEPVIGETILLGEFGDVQVLPNRKTFSIVLRCDGSDPKLEKKVKEFAEMLSQNCSEVAEEFVTALKKEGIKAYSRKGTVIVEGKSSEERNTYTSLATNPVEIRVENINIVTTTEIGPNLLAAIEAVLANKVVTFGLVVGGVMFLGYKIYVEIKKS